jgi:hypothetical protein
MRLWIGLRDRRSDGVIFFARRMQDGSVITGLWSADASGKKGLSNIWP